MVDDIAEIAAGLTEAQREVLRLVHPLPDGSTMVASASVTKAEPWPEGFAIFHSYEWDLPHTPRPRRPQHRKGPTQ